MTNAAFPAKAGPTDGTRCDCRTGFSREGTIACGARIQGPPLIGVGARLPAKRPVHPTHIDRPCLRLRGQARSYTGFAASHCSRLYARSVGAGLLANGRSFTAAVAGLVQRIRQQAGSFRPYIRLESLLTASRLKPVPHPRSYPFSLTARAALVGPASAGKRPASAPTILRCDE